MRSGWHRCKNITLTLYYVAHYVAEFWCVDWCCLCIKTNIYIIFLSIYWTYIVPLHRPPSMAVLGSSIYSAHMLKKAQGSGWWFILKYALAWQSSCSRWLINWTCYVNNKNDVMLVKPMLFVGIGVLLVADSSMWLVMCRLLVTQWGSLSWCSLCIQNMQCKTCDTR